MKVLILGLNYAPEKIGIAVYTAGMAEALAAAGNEVRVIAGQPYYPAWAIMPGHLRSPSSTPFSIPRLSNSNPEISATTANKDFQEAVRYAVDYDGLLSLVGGGAARPGSIVPTMFGGALPTAVGPVHNLDKAKEALARSGISNPTVEFGYASDLTKNGVSFADVAAKIQQDLQAAGITVELKPEPVSSNIDNYRAGTLQMSVQWWGPDFPDPSNYLLFNPGQKVGLRAGWAEGAAPEVVTLGDKAAAAIDGNERATFYADWQKALNAKGPFISLFQPAAIVVTSKSLGELPYNAMWTVDLGAAKPAAN